jgi:hypothetical protein
MLFSAQEVTIMIKKRTTVYLEDNLLKMLKVRSIKTNQSISEYISRTVYRDMVEEQEDLKDVHKVLNEPTISFEQMVKELGIQNEISG